MSTSVLKALPGKLDIKKHSPSILYILSAPIMCGPGEEYLLAKTLQHKTVSIPCPTLLTHFIDVGNILKSFDDAKMYNWST